MIYFLRRADGAIKIGTTNDYRSRINGLEAEHGKLELLGWIEGGRNKEVELHTAFASTRISISEWFTHSDELVAYINANANKTPSRANNKVTVQISNRSRAILDLVITEHYIKTREKLSHDGALWMLFEKACPEAVAQMKAWGRELPEDVKYDARSRRK